MLDFTDISYSYEGAPALSGVSFHIDAGESVCLLGPNGCGKSTTLRLLNGLVFPDRGTYDFDGETITPKKMKNNKFSKRFHQRIGFVFQDSESQLFCSTVYDEVAFGPRQMGMGEDEVKARVGDCLTLLDLNGFEHRQPYHLSGGEKKKVALAATLALNPEVLVLDEPMNGLDPKTEHWLANFLLALHRSGKTIITSTHDLELARKISGRALLFAPDHTIAADLPVDRLLENRQLLKDVELIDDDIMYFSYGSDPDSHKDHCAFFIHSY